MSSGQNETGFVFLDLQVGGNESELAIAKSWSANTAYTLPCRSSCALMFVYTTAIRLLSMLKKIYNEQRAELCSDTVKGLLSLKMKIDTGCHNTELSPS